MLAHAGPADRLGLDLPAEDLVPRHVVLGRQERHLPVHLGLGPTGAVAWSDPGARRRGARRSAQGGNGGGPAAEVRRTGFWRLSWL
eukprot:14609229-Alexandrium_andersonii.AAC.1